MKTVRLPSGITVKVKPFVSGMIIVEFEDKVKHLIALPDSLTEEEVDKAIHKYLYGYTDETGEHVPGYFELIKSEKSKKERKAWWQS